MDSVELRVVDFGSEKAVASEDGMGLYAVIRDELRSGHSVLLDFDGVYTLTSAFLNAAIGQLLATYTPDELRAKVLIKSDDQDALRLIRRVVERAKDYFDDPDRHVAFRNDVVDAAG